MCIKDYINYEGVLTPQKCIDITLMKIDTVTCLKYLCVLIYITSSIDAIVVVILLCVDKKLDIPEYIIIYGLMGVTINVILSMIYAIMGIYSVISDECCKITIRNNSENV